MKKTSFSICTSVILIMNFLMMTIVNNGEEILSNLFVIFITIILLPGYINAIDAGKKSFIRLESFAFLFLAIISIMRLVNRIDTLPYTINKMTILMAVGLGTLLISKTIIRLIKKKRYS